MESKDSWWEKKAVGNISETIVEMMVKSMPNWQCVRFGVENHIEDLKKHIITNINPTTKKIKSMPDFIAFNTKTEETFFLEVKYRGFVDKRTAGKVEYKLDFLNEYLDHWKGTKLIIVHGHSPYFFVINLDDVKQTMCRKEYDGYRYECYWDFGGIQKGIKDIFPEMSEDIIKRAIDMIPKK
ncbi:hypothetical protein HYT24_00320 [Candidatus Pacearchaeota archaeon]|nr:hypothetical protein [Candidatus Pacearchaeota archaeon]